MKVVDHFYFSDASLRRELQVERSVEIRDYVIRTFMIQSLKLVLKACVILLGL